MKKTILATMLTSIFAATAHGATVYDANGTTLEVYGDVEVQLIKEVADTSDTLINLDDADFGFKVGYDLGNSLTALAVVEMTGEAEREAKGSTTKTSTVDIDDAYVGMSSVKWGTLTAGKQLTISDDMGIGNDYAFGISTSYNGKTNGRQVVKYTVDKGHYYAGLSYLLNTDTVDDTTESVDAKLGARLDSLDLTVFYGNTDLAADSSETLLLEARYAIDALLLSASVGATNNDTTNDKTSFGLAATYQIQKTKLSAAWSLVDEENDDKVNKYFVNAAYKFNNNVTTYVEVGGNDTPDSEVGYALGMAVSF